MFYIDSKDYVSAFFFFKVGEEVEIYILAFLVLFIYGHTHNYIGGG